MNTKVISLVRAPLKRRRLMLALLLVIIVLIAIGYFHENNTNNEKPGIYLSGTLQHVKLNTNYTYQLKVVSDQSYKNAVIVFIVPESDYDKVEKVSLIAHKPLVKSFTVTFQTITGMSTEGVEVSVFSVPSSKSGYLLFSRRFPVTPAPHNETGPLPKHPSASSSSVVGE